MTLIRQPQDLLMDVDELDFLNVDTADNVGADVVVGVDKSLGVPIYSLTGANEDQPLQRGENANLNYNLNSDSTQNVAYISNDKQTKLFPSKLPRLTISNEYSNYVSKLFEIYNDLGEDHRTFTVPTIGLMNNSLRTEHNKIVNLALDTLIAELEFYIESIKSNHSQFDKFIELEDCLTIANCLRTFYFTVDTNIDEDMNRETYINNLLNWINRSDGEPDEEQIEIVFNLTQNSSKSIYKTSLFWKLINKLLLRGLFSQAIACFERTEILSSLESECEVSNNAVYDLISLLKQYPKDTSNTYRNWKSLASDLQQTFSTSETKINGELRDNIEDTLLLISGNKFKILQYSETWYESFSGLMLYYIPSNELSLEYLQISLDAHPLNVTNIWEQPCVDIINGKAFTILPVLESLDTCTAAFIAGLCDAKGVLEEYNTNKKSYQTDTIEDLLSHNNGMASYLLNNFAFELCSHDNKTLWPIAIGLISVSPVDSTNAIRAAISELLPRFPFSTNDDIEWMLTVCAKWRLPEVSKKIYLIAGNKLLAEGNTLEAMTNFSKAGDFTLVKHNAWMIFETSLLSKKPVDDPVLTAVIKNDTEHYIPSELLHCLVTDAMRQALSPYAVLFEFYEAQENKDMEKALKSLTSLIEFQYLPIKYFIIILVQFLFPLFIQNNEIIMDEDIILRIIESCDNRLDSNDTKSNDVYSDITRKLGDSNGSDLPVKLRLFEQLLRKKLSIKFCEEFM